MWGFKLEFKKSLRTKKFWAILIVMLLLYLPVLYTIKMVQPYGREFQPSEIIASLISVTLSLAKFFITILAILLGATAINAEISEGTLRIAISKPISRLAYIAGKLIGHTVALFIAILAAIAVTLIGIALMGVDITSALILDVVLLNLAILLAMVEFLALGYIVSLFVRSTSTAMGVAIILLFLISLMSPILVEYFAYSKAEELTREKFGPNWEREYSPSLGEGESPYDYLNKQHDKLVREYRRKYLLFDPITQLNFLLGNLTKTTHLIVTNKTYYPMKNEGLVLVPDYAHPIGSEVTNSTGEGPCRGADFEGGSRTDFVNGTYVEVEYTKRCYTIESYQGVGYSIKRNLDRLGVMIAILILYLGIGFYRFLRMDLR
ncbi:ABC transporter permease subunit [Thermococcus zilligii]|uniref:ABC transporter permease subunit n=1 Tax=Thermococcus zilligii TaxID=54076 RepID=UPI00029A9580|nr:ABC transporter permease subunit [Thermococcus zilligii]